MWVADRIKDRVKAVRQRMSAYIDPKPETDEEVMPQDYPDIVAAGLDYTDLIGRPGWKRLLDDLERRANERLGTLREAIHADPNTTHSLVSRWREAEETLIFVQNRAVQAIEQRKSVLEDLAIKAGFGSGLEDDGQQDQRVRSYMGVGLIDNEDDNQNQNQNQPFNW